MPPLTDAELIVAVIRSASKQGHWLTAAEIADRSGANAVSVAAALRSATLYAPDQLQSRSRANPHPPPTWTDEYRLA